MQSLTCRHLRLIRAVALALAFTPSYLLACDARVSRLLDSLPQLPDTNGQPVLHAGYWDPDARTSRLDALKTYWYASAGCDLQALAAAQQFAEGPAYLAGAGMRRTGRVDDAGYAVLEKYRLAGLAVPMLLAPLNETWLYRYAQREEYIKNEFRSPLAEMYKLLHAAGQYERAVALVERNGPFKDGDDLIKLELAWAYARLGRDSEAQALWQPLLKYHWFRGVQANTLGAAGRLPEAWSMIAASPRAEQGKMMLEYLETSGDFKGVLQHVGRMSTCQLARFEAMQGHYLRAIDLAGAGFCEKKYSYVPATPSHRLAQRFTTTGLYEVAAKKGDGLVFRHLARRAGASEGYHYIQTTPVVLALVAQGRDVEARRVLAEDGPIKEFRSWNWEDVAHLAGPGFAFEPWLALYIEAGHGPATDAPLMKLAQSFARQQPSEAIAWFETHRGQLPAWQQRQFIFGLIRGLMDAGFGNTHTGYKPVAPAYRQAS